MSPTITRVAEQLNLSIEEIDVDVQFEFTQKMKVQGIPVIILVDDDNNEIYRQVGSSTKTSLLENLSKHITG